MGTFSAETSDDVEYRLKEQMVILVYNALGKMKAQGLKVTDLAANLTNIEQVVLALAPDNFGQYGVEINKISGLTISLPDEVQKAIDTRSQMQVLGVNYMQYQAGQAMTTRPTTQRVRRASARAWVSASAPAQGWATHSAARWPRG